MTSSGDDARVRETRLREAVDRALEHLQAGRRQAEEDLSRSPVHGTHVDMLRRIRTFHKEVLLPAVNAKRSIVEHVGALWLEEDIDPPHQMPRAFVRFSSISAHPMAPRAYMTFHVAEDGTALVSRNFETPVKTTEVTLGRLEELSPETVSAAIDDFLLRALNA
ncbi:hypothetical protein JL101_017570 [Skermanella rosea]|uniref:hypothetical protein n=1 Tax=Skermanella rosea TaxID=1817965 RepID=UPI0019345E2D|nr:hypothetical protein [Skermanella rosea]UEM01805.1 hypothetical protein JL101_017570 [Skermanella rosea]